MTTTVIEVLVLFLLTLICINITCISIRNVQPKNLILVIVGKIFISVLAALVLAFNARAVMIHINTIPDDKNDIIFTSMIDVLSYIKPGR